MVAQGGQAASWGGNVGRLHKGSSGSAAVGMPCALPSPPMSTRTGLLGLGSNIGERRAQAVPQFAIFD